MNQRLIYGYFLNETDLKEAIPKLQADEVDIYDVRTPFPVHGLEHILKYKRSHLPKVAFWGGALGLAIGLGFQVWVFTKAWPMNFGGKPHLSIPSFIPVAFEVTVLVAAFAIVIAFLVRSRLGAGAPSMVLDERVTDDHFQIIVSESDQYKANDLVQELQDIGCKEVTIIENG